MDDRKISRNYLISIGFDVVIDKGSTNGVIRTAVNVTAVTAFAVCLLIELKRRIWTDIFDVFCSGKYEIIK